MVRGGWGPDEDVADGGPGGRVLQPRRAAAGDPRPRVGDGQARAEGRAQGHDAGGVRGRRVPHVRRSVRVPSGDKAPGARHRATRGRARAQTHRIRVRGDVLEVLGV